MRKAEAIVRIVHRKEPEQMPWDEFCKLYGEAVYYLQFNADLIARSLSKIFSESK